MWFNLGAVHTNPEKKCGFKNVPDSFGHGLYALFTRRKGNPGARRVTLAISHFVFFTRRVHKAGSGYPSAFRHSRGHLRVSPSFALDSCVFFPFRINGEIICELVSWKS